MAKVTWIHADGSQQTAEVGDGVSLMDAAVQNGVHGIVGECGGGLMCATCHVYVDEPFMHLVGEPSPMEDDMLDVTAAQRQRGSRLSCQLIAAPALDGIVLRVPDAA
jgi:ferredoxin, 2Fe-2S